MNRYLTPEHLQKLKEQTEYFNMCFQYYNDRLSNAGGLDEDINFLIHQRDIVGRKLLEIQSESTALEDYLR